MRSGLRVVACGALALSVGCSTSPHTQPGDTASADSTPTSVTAVAAPVTSGTQAEPEDALRAASVPPADLAATTDVQVREKRLRSGDAGGPFGQTDLWIGAGPPTSGLQRDLGPGDTPGPASAQHQLGMDPVGAIGQARGSVNLAGDITQPGTPHRLHRRRATMPAVMA